MNRSDPVAAAHAAGVDSDSAWRELHRRACAPYRGAGHFASGWVWLAVKDGKLTIEETHDGDTLADQDGVNPLLVIDLWEHAYYIDFQNRRDAYIDTFLDSLVNWEFAAKNYASA